MTAPLRRWHLRAWIGLALLLPIILLAALAARRPEPGVNQLPPQVFPLEAER